MLQNIFLLSNHGEPLTPADFQIFATRDGTAVAEACCEAGYRELPTTIKLQMTQSFLDSFSGLASWRPVSPRRFCLASLRHGQ